MFLYKFVQNLVGDFFNLVIVELLYQPVQHVPLNPEISLVNVWNVVLIVDQGRQDGNAQAGRFLLIANLRTRGKFLDNIKCLLEFRDEAGYSVRRYLDKYYALLVTLVVNILHRFQNFSRHRISRFIWAEMV